MRGDYVKSLLYQFALSDERTNWGAEIIAELLRSEEISPQHGPFKPYRGGSETQEWLRLCRG